MGSEFVNPRRKKQQIIRFSLLSLLIPTGPMDGENHEQVELQMDVSICAIGSIKSLFWGLAHPTFNDGNPYNGQINPHRIEWK